LKASLILFTLSLSIGANGAYAKQLKPYDDPHSIQGMHHDEAGTVTYRGELGGRGGEIFSLKIGPVHEGKSWVAVYVGANGCLGDIAGQATVRGDVLQFTKDDGGNDCRLTIHRSETGATIAESNCVSGHGLSCSFDTQGKTLHQVSVATAATAAAPVVQDRAEQAEGLSKEICKQVLFYPGSLLIRDNGAKIFIEAPKYDPKDIESYLNARQPNVCYCVSGKIKAVSGRRNTFAFTELSALKTCGGKVLK
jgi:hypothetical protein